MIAGLFSAASSKVSHMILAPSPIYDYTSYEPASHIKYALVWLAHAQASRVLPVPGGPYNSIPLDGYKPILSNLDLYNNG